MKNENILGKTIVITGGASGIGLELVKRLYRENTVIVIGRDKKKLVELEAMGIATFTMDISDAHQRRHFYRWLDDTYPEFDTLINNAGWCSFQTLTERIPSSDLRQEEDFVTELKHNLEAHIGMCLEALPRLLKKPGSLIMNVTTGLVYNPKTAMPYYCAAKAGLHSFTVSLREQTRHQNLRVVEALPPLVNTPFHRNGLPDTVKAMTPQKAAEDILKGLNLKKEVIRVGLSNLAYWLNRFLPALGLRIVNQ